MIRFHKTPWITKKWYPSFVWNIPSENSIFLTFDDGPHPEITGWILKELSKYNASASFFCIGEHVDKYRDIAEQVVSQGHVIANHTYNHLKGWAATVPEYLEDVERCDEVLTGLGIENNFFRPPYGRIKKVQARGLQHKQIIMWSHLSSDFSPKLNVKKSLDNLKKAMPGDILLFHENEKSFQNLKVLLPVILDHFQSKGYKLESIK